MIPRLSSKGRFAGNANAEAPSSKVLHIDHAREVWRVNRVECYTCGAEHIGVVHREADPNTLECAACGHLTGVVTERFAIESED